MIELLDDGSNNTKGGESLFLIEGQLVKSVGEEWKATSLIYSHLTTTVKKTKEEEEENLKKRSKEEDDDDELLDGTRRLSGEQPAKKVESPTTDDTSATAAAVEAKHPSSADCVGFTRRRRGGEAYLKRINAETIPHGNHHDFLYKNHLLHFCERRRKGEDEEEEENEEEHDGMCGKDCLEQHNSSKRFNYVQNHGQIAGVIRRQRKGHEQNLGGGDYVPLQRSSARANGKENESKEEEEEREENQKDTVVDIRQLVEHERRGGNEVASQTRFKVEGICCPSEVPLIHNILDSMSGVRDVKVIVPTKMVLVEHAKSYAPVELLVDALNAAHLRIRRGRGLLRPKERRSNIKISRDYGQLTRAEDLLACLFTIVSLLHFIKDDRGVFEHFKWVALGAIAVGLPEILLKSYGSLRMRVVDINTLMAIAIAGAVALQDFFEAAAVVSLFTLSNGSSLAMAKTSDAMSAVLALRVDEAELVNKDDQTTQKVAVESVNVDAIVRVRPGARVPLDGIVVDGSTAIDESVDWGIKTGFENRRFAGLWWHREPKRIYRRPRDIGIRRLGVFEAHSVSRGSSPCAPQPNE